MPTATLTSKGQITVPKRVRDALRVTTGDQLDFVINDRGEVVVHAVNNDVSRLKGLLRRRRRPVSVEAMNQAVLREHSKKR